MEFVNLHVQTDHSILDSLISVEDLFKKTKELGQTAVAITDHGTLGATWSAYKMSKETGIKLIIGCEFYFQEEINEENKLNHIIFIAKNAIGYKNLLTLNKLGFDQGSLRGKKVYSIIDWKLIEKYSEGLICSTACGNGLVSSLLMNKKFDEAEAALLKLKDIFKENLAIEVQPNNMKRGASAYNDSIDQTFLNNQLINLGKKLDIKVIAACNSHYVNKEDHETHDVLLAIGSHQNIYSNFRLKYNVPEFYLKSGEEVKKFFTRNFGEEKAIELCENTVYFANMCEIPDWIDPKYSNSSGKELPHFPVQDQKDYKEFKIWLSLGDIKIQTLDEDAAYLRYKCFESFKSMQKTKSHYIDNEKLYIDRINEELDVLDYQKFSSYLLMVSDYVNWAKDNGILVGAGRGCLQSNTKVLTNNGYVNIQDLNVNDFVYTHTGNLQKIYDIHSYDIDEECIEFKNSFNYKPITMTTDHKVLVSRRQESFYYKDYVSQTGEKRRNKQKTSILSDLSWLNAKDIKAGDHIYTPFVDRNISSYIFDLSEYSDKITNAEIYDNHINYKLRYTKNIKNNLSNQSLNKIFGKGENFWSELRRGTRELHKEIEEDFLNLLREHNLSLNQWKNNEHLRSYNHNRFINFDENFAYLLGRWVGDGSYNKDYGINIAFHINDNDGMEKIEQILHSYGFETFRSIRADLNCTCVVTNNKLLVRLFKSLINDYFDSETKHLPKLFRHVDDNILRSLILGIIDSDGCIYQNNTIIIATVSERLALELKEALLLIRQISNVHFIKANDYGKKIKNKRNSYHISFVFDRIGKFKKNSYITVDNSGYFCKIFDIKKINTCKKVYDISVENDHSFITTSGVVHNSIGGCFLAYLLNIHEADSIQYGLIFARFQNKMRTECPDADVDIASSDREKVTQYINNKYGKDNVCAISNFNTITPKVYIKDLARAMEFGGSKDSAIEIGNTIAASIPAEVSVNSIDDLLKQCPIIAEYAKKYPEIIKHGTILGRNRSASQHAAGICVSQRSLVGLVPLRQEKTGATLIEYEKEQTEQNGLVKIDLLALSCLDDIRDTLNLIKQSGKPFNNEHKNYDANDAKTYELISSGNTFKVFQLGASSGTIDLCKKIKPKSIYDLAVITTLARPAAANIRQDFINTRAGKKEYCLFHPSLSQAFEKTYGYGLFDESILQLGKDVAGWDLNSADRLRKMIKEKGKYPEKDKKLRQEFIDSAHKNNNIEPFLGVQIWDNEIKKFAGYTFNLAHSVTYSMISYETAYLKAHFPVEFLLACLKAESQSASPQAAANIDKIKRELRAYKVKISAPDINKSKMSYSLEKDNKLLTGLDALKFVGEDAIKDIIEKRPFIDFFDFMQRVDSRKVRANNIQALAASGALDCFRIPRKQIFLYCSDYRKKLQVWLKKHDPTKEEFIYPFPKEEPWPTSELYALESHYLGEGFICKAKDAYVNFFKQDHATCKYIKSKKDKTKISSIKGIIKDFFEFRVKKEGSKYQGQPMIKCLVEDMNGEQYGCTIFPDNWQEAQNRIKQINSKAKFDVGLAIHFTGAVNNYDGEIGIIVDEIINIQQAPNLPADRTAKKINLKAAKNKDQVNLFEEIEDNLYNEGLIDLDNEKD